MQRCNERSVLVQGKQPATAPLTLEMQDEMLLENVDSIFVADSAWLLEQ